MINCRMCIHSPGLHKKKTVHESSIIQDKRLDFVINIFTLTFSVSILVFWLWTATAYVHMNFYNSFNLSKMLSWVDNNECCITYYIQKLFLTIIVGARKISYSLIESSVNESKRGSWLFYKWKLNSIKTWILISSVNWTRLNKKTLGTKNTQTILNETKRRSRFRLISRIVSGQKSWSHFSWYDFFSFF